MIKRLGLSFSVFALVVASAASKYTVTLYQPSIVNGTELKPGDYKVEVSDNTVTISKGKQSVQAPVKTETADSKFPSTSVRYLNGDGKYRVQEIRIGGTNTKLVFSN